MTNPRQVSVNASRFPNYPQSPLVFLHRNDLIAKKRRQPIDNEQNSLVVIFIPLDNYVTAYAEPAFGLSAVCGSVRKVLFKKDKW